MFLKCFGPRNSSKGRYPTIIEELCHQFSLSDLRKSTNNFDESKVIGHGAFSKIYEGCLQSHDASDYLVAVKRFKVEYSDVFKKEIELLCQLHHPNCVSLIGFCNDKNEKIIVYEYMSNRSLDKHLQRGELSWKKRLEICIGVARGLHYLHTGAKRSIFHCMLQPSTILLDANMKPKLAGFGVSIQGARFDSKPKQIDGDHVMDRLGYMTLEYAMDGNVTDKWDVFSFGMALLPVVCAMNYLVIALAGEDIEMPVEKNIDPNIKGKIAPQCWHVFADIMVRCFEFNPDERPTMGEVEVQLEHALTLQEQADIRNTLDDYTLLSKTILPVAFGRKMKQYSNTQDSDIEEIEGSRAKVKFVCGVRIMFLKCFGHTNSSDTDGELSWKKRLEICIGAARGLHYLHAGAKRTIIHRRIEPSNIVLDNNMQPKLTDFGISVLGARFMSKPKPIKVDSIGTLRYMAPEYYRDSTVTDKCDVYSFGLVLLQVVWGRKILDILSGRNYQKKRVEDNIDPNIKGKIAPECWQVFMGITERCVKFEPEERPAMGEVEVELEHAPLLQEQVDISNTDGILGLVGYMPLEYVVDGITDKWDVFSFGMTLLPLVCAMNHLVISIERELLARELLEKPVEENIDPNIQGKISPECWQVFADIMVRCLELKPDERPTMGEVEVQLEHALALQEQADVTNIDDSSDTGRGYPTVIEELCRPFSLADLNKATNNFDKNRLIEDEGYYRVYKGYLQHNDSSGYAVAVKRFELEGWKEEFKTEIELLCQLRHPNIISLVGFCIHEKYEIVVNEYMSNGSLLAHLEGGELSWKKRLEICIGAARGLHYLHTGAKRTIIHRDIRSSNILLDHNMHPKLTDFGISVQGAHFRSKPKPIKVDFIGASAYAAPEYYRDSTVTDKYDVYSFGLVLLQIVWGRKISDIVTSGNYHKFLEDNIDPNIKGKITPQCWQVFINITQKCVKPEPDVRPAMGEVEVELERALSLQEQTDFPNTNVKYLLLSKTIIGQYT
ncbi:hypothetical protein Fmac_017381 [Flemingia macrophylla]|uniref:Protein kinase domain-containing protein n=1 Tax=Flemingia macrophylla TaxID=520843 RepID=A0ABD1M1Z3_9FABA